MPWHTAACQVPFLQPGEVAGLERDREGLSGEEEPGAGHQSHGEHPQRADCQGQLQRAGAWNGTRPHGGWIQIHGLDDLDVVKQGDDAVHPRDHGQAIGLGLDGGAEDPHLGEKSGQGGYPGE